MTKAAWLKPHHFKKGVSGNPGGCPKLPPALKSIASVTQPEIAKLFAKYARMNPDELAVVMADRATSILDRVIVATLVKAAEGGDFARLTTLLDRVLGRVNIIEDDASPRSVLQDLSPKDLLALLATVQAAPKLEPGVSYEAPEEAP